MSTSTGSQPLVPPFMSPLVPPPLAPPPPVGFNPDRLTIQFAASVSILSALGSLCVLGLIIRPTSLAPGRQRDGRGSIYIASMSVASLLNAFAYIWGWLSHGEPGIECKVQATLFIFSEDAMALWSLAIAMVVYQSIVLRVPDRLMLLWQFAGWGVPAAISTVLLALKVVGPVTEKAGLWCWIHDADGGMDDSRVRFTVSFIDLFRWLIFLMIAALYLRIRREFGSLVLEGLLAPSRERRALRRLWLHLLVFLATRILYVLINVHELIWPTQRLPWPCYFFSSAAAASTGALNALVYGCSPESALTACHERASGCNLFAACQLCCPRCWLAVLGGGSSSSPKSWETPLSSVGTYSPTGGGGGAGGSSWGGGWGGDRRLTDVTGGEGAARGDGASPRARTPRSLLSAAASVAATPF